MMRREFIQARIQDPWSVIENNNNLGSTTLFDPALLQAAADQVLQLQDLFGQDELDFDLDASLIYDEFTFVPESNNVDTVEPSDLIHKSDLIVTTTTDPMTKRRRSSSSSLSSYSSSSSSSSEEEDTSDFSSLNNRRMSSSISWSDSEVEETKQPYMHRRQVEEMILEKITNYLEAEKLPGILQIISRKHDEGVEEVEIDLARLDRDQLERILSYVNACLLERQGGPKVIMSDYIKIVEEKKPAIKAPVEEVMTKSKRRRNNKNRRKPLMGEGHTVCGSSSSQLSASYGPISMSALTVLEGETRKRKPQQRRRKKNKDNESVHMSTTNLNTFQESIASTKPKRKSAVHKRRLLEQMLQPSVSSSDDEQVETESGIIVFGDEQMDFAVTQNETIVHQAAIVEYHSPSVITDDAEDDELIDIMV